MNDNPMPYPTTEALMTMNNHLMTAKPNDNLMTINDERSSNGDLMTTWLITTSVLFIILCFAGCSKGYSPEEQKYIEEIEKFRTEKNMEMKTAAYSPFVQDRKAHFEPLKYFDVNPDFVFKSKLYDYNPKDTIKVFGTKGEERIAIRFGFINFNFEEEQYKINVYKGFSRKTGEEYFSIWFTDKTTNNETYGVGRYIDFEKDDNKDYVYTIDFNLAYNPYCAYSSMFSCAIPTKEDYIDLAIEAGEKKFHN